MLGVLYVRGQHFNVIQGKGGGAGVRILVEERASQEAEVEIDVGKSGRAIMGGR